MVRITCSPLTRQDKDGQWAPRGLWKIVPLASAYGTSSLRLQSSTYSTISFSTAENDRVDQSLPRATVQLEVSVPATYSTNRSCTRHFDSKQELRRLDPCLSYRAYWLRPKCCRLSDFVREFSGTIICDNYCAQFYIRGCAVPATAQPSLSSHSTCLRMPAISKLEQNAL